MQPILLGLFCLFSVAVAEAKRPPQQVLRVRLTNAPSTLDWNIATSGSENAIIQNIMRGLFSQDVTGFPKPDLAKNVVLSKDLKTLTLSLKPDVKWNDGKSLRAEDFIYSFERLLDPRLNSENASLLFDVVGARDYFLGKSKHFSDVGITAPTPLTLVFSLNEPRANFLEILTHGSTFPMRKDQPKETLGAYRIQSQTASAIKLKATHADAEIKEALFEIIPNGSDALKAFHRGKVDYLLQLEDSLINSTELTGLPKPALVDSLRVIALLHFNPSRLPTNAPEKRRGIMEEIPLQNLLEGFTNTRVAASSIIPPGTLGGPLAEHPHETFKPIGTSISHPTEPLTLGFPDDALSRSIAETLQKNAGSLKITIEALPKGEFSTVSKRYDLVLTLYGLDYPDPDQLLSSFLSQGTHDLFNVSSGELLKIMQKARVTEDLQARGKLYQDAADLLQNKLAIVMPLFYRRRAFLMRTSFTFDERRQGTANLTQIHPKK